MAYKTKIKSVKAAFKYMGLDIKKQPVVSGISAVHKKFIIAAYKLSVWMEALNKEANDGKQWRPNWTDGSDKWFLWLYAEKKAKGAGCVLSHSPFVFSYSYTPAGSRLAFKTRDTAEYAWSNKEFKKLCQDYYLFT